MGVCYTMYVWNFHIKKSFKKIGDNYIEDPVCQMYSKEQKGVSWGLESPVISFLIFVKVEAHTRSLNIDVVVSEIYRQRCH